MQILGAFFGSWKESIMADIYLFSNLWRMWHKTLLHLLFPFFMFFFFSLNKWTLQKARSIRTYHFASKLKIICPDILLHPAYWTLNFWLFIQSFLWSFSFFSYLFIHQVKWLSKNYASRVTIAFHMIESL